MLIGLNYAKSGIILSLFILITLIINQNIMYSQTNLPPELLKHPDKKTYNNPSIIKESNELIEPSDFKGNFQIVIYNTDDKPDDIWRVVVDQKELGTYLKGKLKWWDLILTPGNHEVIVEDAYAEDRTGNYSIWFGGVKKIKGPPVESFNASEQQNYIWTIEIPNQ